MKNWKKILIIVLSPLLLVDCGSEEVGVVLNVTDQFEAEKVLIRRYLTEIVMVEEDTTEFGVRLVVLEDNGGALPLSGDLVSFDFTGRVLREDDFGDLLDVDVFDSSIFSVVNDELGIEINDENRYIPIIYTYSTNGWTLTSLSGGPDYVPGFRDGVTELLKRVGAGGTGEIVIPSVAAFGTLGSGTVNANETVIFKIENINIIE